MNRFERKSKTIIGLILVLAFGLVVAAAEWVLTPDQGKIMVRGHDSLPVPHRHLALREWLPSAVYEFAAPEIRKLNPGGEVLDIYKLETDRDGFIKPARLHAAADRQIVFLGGSTTECLYVAPQRRFPHRVGRLLEAELGVRINAFNAGKSGNNTMHSMLAFMGKVLPLTPDYVVLMHNANDLGVLTRDGGYWTDESNFALVRVRRRTIETVVKDLRDIAVPYSYRGIRRVLRNGFSSSARAAEAASAPAPGPAGKLDRYGRTFESAIRSFVAVAKAWGVRPVLMTQAQIGSTVKGAHNLAGDYLNEARLRRRGFTAGQFITAHGYFNAIIRHVALSEGALLIDLADRGWTADALYDGMHFTDQGSERAAGIIAEALAREMRADLKGSEP